MHSATDGSPANPGDQRLPFESYSLRRGLSQSIVECILLDRRGFLWLGTEDGLNRFDGYDFRVFRHSTDDPESLSYSEVKTVIEDRSGALWVGTFGGLNRFDPDSERCRRFLHRPGDPATLADDFVRALVEDGDGRLWVGTFGGGLDRLDPGGDRFHHLRHDPGDPASLADDRVRVLLEDDRGRLWVGTQSGLDCLQPGDRGFRHHRHDPADPGSLSHDEVSALHLDGRGRLWVGTAAGVDRYEPGGRFVRYGPAGVAGAPVTCFCEDDHGRLWVGSDGGGLTLLDAERGALANLRHQPRDDGSLPTDRVLCSLCDASGTLWLGTYGGGLTKGDRRRARFAHYRCRPEDPLSLSHGIVWSIYQEGPVLWVGTDGGLDRLDREQGTIERFHADPGDPQALAHPGVRVVYAGPSGTLWVGTNGGLHRLDRESGRFHRYTHDPGDPESLVHDEIRCLYEDAAGTLWVGTLGGGVDRLDPGSERFHHLRHDPDDPSSLGSDYIRQVFEDRRGRMWIGTQGAGLALLDPATGRCRHFRHRPDDPATLSSDHVFSIWEAEDGILWIGTYGGGLDRLDPESGRVRRYGEDDGLPANLIYGLVGDEHGDLWISTNRGLARFDPRRGDFRTYDWQDGLQSDEFNGGSYHRGADGELFFGGIDGFNAFYPAAFEDSDFAPPVVLTDLWLAGRRLRPGDTVAGGRVPLPCCLTATRTIHLTHRDRVFSIGFSALDLTNPRKNRFAYRLLGFERRWTETGADHRVATYTNLPPGQYRFEVRGTNCDGVWSPHTAAVRLDIAPPVWGTWWFRGLAAATAAGLAVRSYHHRVSTIRMQTELGAAREAQRSIWPHDDPRLPGYEIAGISLPASEAGGDFFDFIWLDAEHTHLCIAVGDVAGKGMSAAMTAVLASGVIAAKLEEGLPLDQAVARINRFLYRKTPSRRFTALCLASISAPDGKLSFLNAGLTEPLLRSHGGVRSLASPDPRFPLGIQLREAHRERRTPLAPGDVLVIYSDGLPEAQSRHGEVYGYAGLEQRLATLPSAEMSARQIVRALLDDVHRFAGGRPQQDDMTVVAVKVLSAPPAV